jgi:hypothetical protein
MKKILLILFSVVIASSFSAVVRASSLDSSRVIKITKQIVLSDEEPAPAPPPEPTPAPAPEPKPY